MLCSIGIIVFCSEEYIHLQFRISFQGVHGLPEVHLGEPSRSISIYTFTSAKNPLHFNCFCKCPLQERLPLIQVYCKGGKKRNPQLDGLSVVLVPTFYVCPSHQDCFLVSSKHNQTIDLHGSVRGIFLLKSLSFSWNIPACHTSNNLNDYHQGTGESILVNPFHGLCCIH